MTTVITIRLSVALHNAIKELAYQTRQSMNHAVVDILTHAALRHPVAAGVLEKGRAQSVTS
jgi:predicted transcriptional regulator